MRSSWRAQWRASCAGSDSRSSAFHIRCCSARWQALEFIPLVGPLVVAIVASIVAALHAPMLVLWTAGFLGTFRVVEDYVIYPRLIRRGIPLHPLAVILAVLAGAELDGVAGMFLAVPVVGILSVVYRHAVEWRGGDATHRAADLLVTSQPADV